MTGRVETFGHLVQIETLGVVVDSMVYFFANEAITKSVLGRLASSTTNGRCIWRLTISNQNEAGLDCLGRGRLTKRTRVHSSIGQILHAKQL